MKLIALVIPLLFFKCNLYSQDDCSGLILGQWENYNTINPIDNSTKSKSDNSTWIFEKDSLKIDNNLIFYVIENDCEYIILKNKTKGIKLEIIKSSKDSLNFCHKNNYVGNIFIFLKRVSSTE